ncbi:VTT domain-containing protein [Chitinophaga deserti]|uniref:VTT domain-containing protein n=1 Tax=Chitinophaga deserti TaxID=2164099 RepID=UPI000D6B6AD4|nr:VTT domain-containing protein [Chitinophaga deserti]
MPRNNATVTGRNLRIIWATTLLGSIAIYFLYAQHLSAGEVSAFVGQYPGWTAAVFFAICVARGLVLIPGTPFLAAGILLFREEPWFLFGLFMASIAVVSWLLYRLSGWLGLAAWFEQRHPEKTARMRQRLEGPYGQWFIALWAFAPVAPTDLACYVAGSVKLPVRKFLPALLAGEAVICGIYIFLLQYI